MTCWSQILASRVRPGVCTAVSSRFFFLPWQVDAPPPAALHGLPFRSPPELASNDQNISEPVGQCLILGRLHTGAGCRQIETACSNPSHARTYSAPVQSSPSFEAGWDCTRAA